MTHESDSKLILLLEQLEGGRLLERDQFIERLQDFEEEEIETLQILLAVVYRVKMVIEGPPPTQTIGGPTGWGIPGTSGHG